MMNRIDSTAVPQGIMAALAVTDPAPEGAGGDDFVAVLDAGVAVEKLPQIQEHRPPNPAVQLAGVSVTVDLAPPPVEDLPEAVVALPPEAADPEVALAEHEIPGPDESPAAALALPVPTLVALPPSPLRGPAEAEGSFSTEPPDEVPESGPLPVSRPLHTAAPEVPQTDRLAPEALPAEAPAAITQPPASGELPQSGPKPGQAEVDVAAGAQPKAPQAEGSKSLPVAPQDLQPAVSPDPSLPPAPPQQSATAKGLATDPQAPSGVLPAQGDQRETPLREAPPSAAASPKLQAEPGQDQTPQSQGVAAVDKPVQGQSVEGQSVEGQPVRFQPERGQDASGEATSAKPIPGQAEQGQTASGPASPAEPVSLPKAVPPSALPKATQPQPTSAAPEPLPLERGTAGPLEAPSQTKPAPEPSGAAPASNRVQEGYAAARIATGPAQSPRKEAPNGQPTASVAVVTQAADATVQPGLVAPSDQPSDQPSGQPLGPRPPVAAAPGADGIDLPPEAKPSLAAPRAEPLSPARSAAPEGLIPVKPAEGQPAFAASPGPKATDPVAPGADTVIPSAVSANPARPETVLTVSRPAEPALPPAGEEVAPLQARPASIALPPEVAQILAPKAEVVPPPPAASPAPESDPTRPLTMAPRPTEPAPPAARAEAPNPPPTSAQSAVPLVAPQTQAPPLPAAPQVQAAKSQVAPQTAPDPAKTPPPSPAAVLAAPQPATPETKRPAQSLRWAELPHLDPATEVPPKALPAVALVPQQVEQAPPAEARESAKPLAQPRREATQPAPGVKPDPVPRPAAAPAEIPIPALVEALLPTAPRKPAAEEPGARPSRSAAPRTPLAPGEVEAASPGRELTPQAVSAPPRALAPEMQAEAAPRRIEAPAQAEPAAAQPVPAQPAPPAQAAIPAATPQPGVSSAEAALQTAALQSEATRRSVETARDFAPRVVRKITETGARKSEIVLEPAELGRLRFELVTRGDRVEVNMMAERPETLDLLRHHVAELRQEFRAAGLDAGAMNFGQWSQGGREDRSPLTPFAPTEGGFDTFDQTLPSPPPEARTVSSGLDLRL